MLYALYVSYVLYVLYELYVIVPLILNFGPWTSSQPPSPQPSPRTVGGKFPLLIFAKLGSLVARAALSLIADRHGILSLTELLE